MKPPRKSLKDTRRDNALAMNYYAKLSDKPAIDVPEGSKKLGPRQPRTHGLKSESTVQQEIIDWLLESPHVAVVERINSGTMQEGDRYISFNVIMIPRRLRSIARLLRVRKADLDVQLMDGKRLIIECKKEGWNMPADTREREQANYLSHMREHGAIAIFAQSLEDVKTALVAHGYE